MMTLGHCGRKRKNRKNILPTTGIGMSNNILSIISMKLSCIYNIMYEWERQGKTPASNEVTATIKCSVTSCVWTAVL